MQELLDALRQPWPAKTVHRFWHPSRMRSSLRIIPVVSAALPPPATVWHPSGMNRSGTQMLRELTPPRFPMNHLSQPHVEPTLTTERDVRGLVKTIPHAEQEVAGPHGDRQSSQRVRRRPAEDQRQITQIQRGNDEQVQPQFQIQTGRSGLVIRRHPKTPFKDSECRRRSEQSAPCHSEKDRRLRGDDLDRTPAQPAEPSRPRQPIGIIGTLALLWTSDGLPGPSRSHLVPRRPGKAVPQGGITRRFDRHHDVLRLARRA